MPDFSWDDKCQIDEAKKWSQLNKVDCKFAIMYEIYFCQAD